MKFSSIIFLSQNQACQLPITYRKNFMSLIKEALSSENGSPEFFRQYYGDKKQNMPKPFTFSVQLPIRKQEKDFFILYDNRIRFHFSSSDPLFFISVYNGLVNMEKDFSPFPGHNIKIRNFYLHKKTPIDSNEAVFKTYSPFLVRDIQEKKGQGFISFEHENFEDQVFNSIRNKCRNFISPDYELAREDFEIMIVKCRSDIINHYGGEIGISGILKIKAPKEVLQLVYDAGLGAKTSQGFGMVEVVG